MSCPTGRRSGPPQRTTPQPGSARGWKPPIAPGSCSPRRRPPRTSSSTPCRRRRGSTGHGSRPSTSTSTSGCPWATPRSFGQWLEEHIWSRVHPGRIEKLDGGNPDPDAECARYGRLLADGGLDLALIGIGENGHLAFNDPHVADFDDPLVVKPVEIDDMSRHQQVRDGAFPTFEVVPRLALTVTMSTILASRALSVVVPGAQKAAAVAATLDGPIETACPASALRRHPDAVLFVDEAAASQVRR